jgi:hypothetical protein
VEGVKQPRSSIARITYASPALLVAALYAASLGLPWLLRAASRSRRVIAQATGILQSQHAGSPEDAFEWLALTAERDGKTILQVATAVVQADPR